MLSMHPRNTRVWDLMTRVFHWSLVMAFCIAQLTAEQWDIVHEYAGYLILGLVGFRLVWGFVGPQNVRFRQFVKSPQHIVAHLKDMLSGHHHPESGHNPAGGAMVLLLLTWLALAGLTGWGSMLTSGSLSELLETVHEFFGETSVILVALHLLGVVVMSLIERQNLAKAMIDGKKYLPKTATP